MSKPTGRPVYPPLRAQLVQRVPWFFEPCFEHLEFLWRDGGFSYDGECLPYPDTDPLFSLQDERLRIEIVCRLCPRLPLLTVKSLTAKRRVLDLRAIVPQGDPNDDGEQASGDGFEAAVATRIAAFAGFLRQHLDKLRRAA